MLKNECMFSYDLETRLISAAEELNAEHLGCEEHGITDSLTVNKHGPVIYTFLTI